jgi:hypothetical protein
MMEMMLMSDAAARICELHPGLSADLLAEELELFCAACEAAMPDPVAVGDVIRLYSECECSRIVRAAGKVELSICNYGDWIAVQMWDIKRDVELLRCNIQM